MEWENGNRYGDVEDRRGLGPAHIAGGGIGGLALGLLGYYFFGINPFAVMNVVNSYTPTVEQHGQVGAPGDRMGRFVDTILSSTTDVWRAEFQNMGKTYRPPNPLVLYTRATGTGCGLGQSAMGPFYCPMDQRVYLDLEFFQELGARFRAPGDFAQAYVLAHEVGHHVQQLLGTGDQVQRLERSARSETDANRYSVSFELQADCFAGVWAAHASEVSGGRVSLDPGDLEEGLKAAAAVGDDTLQQQARGRVMPDSFTHGSAAQRTRWLQTGYSSGDLMACTTFNGKLTP
jgi:uncharacterized protein